jgi:hypothetical protein
MITQARLKELLHYDPETGEFTWIGRALRSRMRPGMKAGTICTTTGYRMLNVDGHRCIGHRLAWFYVYGRWPAREIDHINGIRADNRIINLREATRWENLANAKRRDYTNPRGTRFEGARNRWRAQIKVRGKQICLGTFLTAEDAHKAYVEAAKKYHGEFARFD